MYTALGGIRFAHAALIVFAVILLFSLWWVDTPNNASDVLHLALKAAGLFITGLTLTFGFSSYWAPWRILWRWFPALDQIVFPDINGVWLGETCSNWPVIEATRKAASGGGGANLEHIGKTVLKIDPIVMEIRASLFRISLRSVLSATKGESRSLFAAVHQDSLSRDFSLIYLFRQKTPDPDVTDEDSHDGAANLQIRIDDKLDGVYWNRRKWREGMNTAGRIELRRVSSKHAGNTLDLFKAAQEAETT